MAKYLVKAKLWSPSLQRFIEKGETIEMDENMQTTIVLLKKGAIDVAIYKPVARIKQEEISTIPVIIAPPAIVTPKPDIQEPRLNKPFIKKAKTKGR